MASTKISALTASTSLDGTEIVPLSAGGANEGAPVSQVHAGALIYLNADYTLTSSTAQQKLFNTTTNGALTISNTGLYEFEAQIYLTTMSTTSGNGVFSLIGAGTATLAGQLMGAVGIDATTPATAAAQGGAFIQAASVFTTNMVTAGTGTAMGVTIKGVFKVTATGTIIPSIALTTANAAVVKAGSWYRCKMLAPASTYSVGAWS